MGLSLDKADCFKSAQAQAKVPKKSPEGPRHSATARAKQDGNVSFIATVLIGSFMSTLNNFRVPIRNRLSDTRTVLSQFGNQYMLNLPCDMGKRAGTFIFAASSY